MWSRASIDRLRRALVPAVVAGLLAACASGPVPTQTPASAAAAASASPAGSGNSVAGSTAQSGSAGVSNSAPNNGATGGGAPGGAPATQPPVEITARGKADFDRAVGFMRAGNATEAELEFKQVALQFPQLAAPYVNLGILYRKTGRLDQSEAALKTAVERNGASAVAWTELGATQRLRGEFPSAAESYEHAIAADPNFAPAYRNLGVVSDLYLGDPERALTAFERYKELTGEEKPVNGWIAELRQRTGKPPLKRPAPAPAAGATDSGNSAAPADKPADSGKPADAGQPADAPDARAPANPPRAGERS